LILDSTLTKVLAACIAVIDKRISSVQEEFSESILDLKTKVDAIGPFTLSEQEKQELSESILEAVPLKSLPKEIVFDFELADVKKELLSRINQDNSALKEYIEQNFEVIGKAIVNIRDKLSAHHHDDQYSSVDHDHDQYSTVDEVSKLSDRFDNHKHDDSYVGHDQHKESVDKTAKELEGIKSRIEDSVSVLASGLSTKVSSEEFNSHKDSVNSTSDAFKASLSDLNESLVLHKDSVENRLLGHSDALQKLSDHAHDQYASNDHIHDDLASKDDLAILGNDVKQFNLELADLSRLVNDQFDELVNELTKKQPSGEFVTQDDLEGHKQAVLDAAIKTIPTPVNGKDALGWDFKPHATKKGILLYKRDDWKDYKELVLFDEKWMKNLSNKFGQALQQNRELEQPRFGFASGAIAPSSMASLDDVSMNGIQEGYVLVYSQSLNKFVPAPITTSTTDEEMPYAKRVDFISDNELYKGEAAVGSSESSAVWRIHKLLIGEDGDVTEIWADGNSNYDNVWTNRLSYIYS